MLAAPPHAHGPMHDGLCTMDCACSSLLRQPACPRLAPGKGAPCHAMEEPLLSPSELHSESGAGGKGSSPGLVLRPCLSCGHGAPTAAAPRWVGACVDFKPVE